MKSNFFLDKDILICRNRDQLFSEVDDEIVMLSISKGEYYNLDEVGSIIWKMLEKPTTLEFVVENLQRKYDVTKDICENDILDFLEELMKKELIYMIDEKHK